MGLGSVTSLGENLFRGLLVINWIIDFWHAAFEPSILWVNENVFQYISFEFSQWMADLVAIAAITGRYFSRGITALAGEVGGFVKGIISGLVFGLIVFDDNPLGYAFGPLYLYSELVALFAFVLFTIIGVGDRQNPNSSIPSDTSKTRALPWAFSLFLFLDLLLTFNAHADRSLPYIERWLQAWDDAVIEEIEGSYRE